MVPVVTVKFSGKRLAKTKKARVVIPPPFDGADILEVLFLSAPADSNKTN